MSDRSRPPTDPQRTAVYDPERAPAAGARPRPRTPTKKGAGVELATPTEVAPPQIPAVARVVELAAPSQAGARGRVELATPTELAAPRLPPPPEVPAPAGRPERSEPIRVISMKAPGEARGDASEPSAPARAPRPRLRSLSEVSSERRALTPPAGLGYLAPPLDPREARTRRRREYAIWGSVVVMLAGAVTLGVWFLAGS